MVDTLACDLVSYVKRKERKSNTSNYCIDSAIADKLLSPLRKINNTLYNAFVYNDNKILLLKANNQEDAISLLLFLFKKYPLLTFLTTLPNKKRSFGISINMFKKYLFYLNILQNYLNETGNSTYISNIDLNIVASRFARDKHLSYRGKYNASLFKQSSPSFWKRYRDKDINKKKSSVLYFLFKTGIIKFEKSISIHSFHKNKNNYYDRAREILKSYSLYNNLPNHLLPNNLIIYKVNYAILEEILNIFKKIENYQFLLSLSNLKRLLFFSLYIAKKFGINKNFQSNINTSLNNLFITFYDFSSKFFPSKQSNILFEFEKEKSLKERINSIIYKQHFVYYSHYRHLRKFLEKESYSNYNFNFGYLFKLLENLEKLFTIFLPLTGKLLDSFMKFRKELTEIMQSCLSKTKNYLKKVIKNMGISNIAAEAINLIDLSTTEDILLLRNILKKVETVVKIAPHKILIERNEKYIQTINLLNKLLPQI
jgi:hypothetical protein